MNNNWFPLNRENDTIRGLLPRKFVLIRFYVNLKKKNFLKRE